MQQCTNRQICLLCRRSFQQARFAHSCLPSRIKPNSNVWLTAPHSSLPMRVAAFIAVLIAVHYAAVASVAGSSEGSLCNPEVIGKANIVNVPSHARGRTKKSHSGTSDRSFYTLASRSAHATTPPEFTALCSRTPTITCQYCRSTSGCIINLAFEWCWN